MEKLVENSVLLYRRLGNGGSELCSEKTVLVLNEHLRFCRLSEFQNFTFSQLDKLVELTTYSYCFILNFSALSLTC